MFPMRLSRQVHYAIRAVLDLQRHPKTRSREIARRQGIPPAYLAKIVQALGRRGIVRTHRGAHGGVQLAMPASALTLREVVEAVEGPLAINQCVVWGDCPCPQPCPVRASLARLQALVEREMESVTVAVLAGRMPAIVRYERDEYGSELTAGGGRQDSGVQKG